MYKIRLVAVGKDTPGIRWQLFEPNAGKPFLEARKMFRVRDDAYRDAEAFLKRVGKQSQRESTH